VFDLKNKLYFLKFLLFVGLIYSFLSFVSSVYFYKAKESMHLKDPQQVMSFFSNAKRWNIFDYRPFINEGRYLKKIGIKKNNDKVLFEKAIKSFKHVNSLGGETFQSRFSLITLLNYLNKKDNHYLNDMFLLCRDYPNNSYLDNLLIKMAFKRWQFLSKEKQNTILILLRKELINNFWGSLKLLVQYSNMTPDFDQVKDILPDNIEYLMYIKYALRDSLCKIDCLWINNSINNILQRDDYNLYLFYISKVEHLVNKRKDQWYKQYGKGYADINKEDLLGDFKNSIKEVKSGNIYANGSVFGILNIQQTVGRIIIKAHSSYVNKIPAYMIVSLNDKVLDGVYVDSKFPKDYEFDYQTEEQGDVLITISFENDAINEKKKEDRNLYVSEIKVL